MIPEPARQLLSSDAPAHVVTIDPDGRPQVTMAWVGLDGDEVVFPAVPQPPPGFVTRVTERVDGVGPWAEERA